MLTCPSCQYVFVFPPAGGRCSQCGAPVETGARSAPPLSPPPGPYAPPFVPAAVPSPATTLTATPPDDDPYHVRITAPPRRPPVAETKRPVPLGMIALSAALLAVGLGGWWLTRGSGGGSPTADDPRGIEVLPELGEHGGLTPIGDARRVGAEANARRAFTAAQVVFAEHGSYRAATPELLSQYQPELEWLPGNLPATDRDQVSVAVTGDTGIVLAVSDGGDVCVFASDDGTGIGGDFVAVRTTAGCRADTPPDLRPA